MGFLRRIGRRNEPVPEWASFFTGEDYAAFLKLVQADLHGRGARSSIGDGFVRMTESGDVYGLTNLAQLCHSTDREEWPGAIARHFSSLETTAARDVDTMAAEFEQIRPILRVRLLADESMGGMSSEEFVGSRAFAPGILLALMYDFPDSTQSVQPKHLDGWPMSADEVWQIAVDNVRLEEPPQRETLPAQGGSFQVAMGNDFYVASRALRLADELPAGTIDAIFATPNRHVLLSHAIGDVSVIGAMQGMAMVAGKMFVDGPGSISNQLYWWHSGNVVHLPVSVSGKATNLTPPDEFVELLNALPPG